MLSKCLTGIGSPFGMLEQARGAVYNACGVCLYAPMCGVGIALGLQGLVSYAGGRLPNRLGKRGWQTAEKPLSQGAAQVKKVPKNKGFLQIIA